MRPAVCLRVPVPDVDQPDVVGKPGLLERPAHAQVADEPLREGRGPAKSGDGDLLHGIIEDLAAGIAPEVIAARFHQGVAALIEAGCLLARERHGLGTVALSGGVFQNQLLLRAAVTRLEARGFRVLVHSRIPCNDGGISLGQAVVAGARDRLTLYQP